MDGAVEWAMIGIFFNQGEVCSAGSRIIIEKSIKDEFVEKLAKKAKAMTIGNGVNNLIWSVDYGTAYGKSFKLYSVRY